jgi:hypothetical protein
VRFFTPERLVQLQDHSDERRFLAALDDWEAAVAGYWEQLHHIQEALPSGLRHLVNTVALHDARVIDLSRGQRSRLTIILQPESDPSRQVVLAYSLIEPAEIVEDVLPEAARSQPLQWLYDELEEVQDVGNSSRRERSSGRKFLHSILLSNGWEVKLRFRRVSLTRPVSLLQRLPACGIAS